jgi:hypothetical protein
MAPARVLAREPHDQLGHLTTDRRQQHAIVLLEPWSFDLPAKDRQLVAEHEDLELLRSVSSPEEHDQLKHTTDDEVQG